MMAGTQPHGASQRRPGEPRRGVSGNVGLLVTALVLWGAPVRAQERLLIVGPLTLSIIVFLLYINFRRFDEVAIIVGTLPMALVGGIWLIYALDYRMSVAVGVGFIALAGVAVEIGVVLLVYLNLAIQDRLESAKAEGRPPGVADIEHEVIHGALLRVRPIIMTVATIIVGLLPIMFGGGTGSEVMRRIAAPMVGGMVSATFLTLIVVPALFLLTRGRELAARRR